MDTKQLEIEIAALKCGLDTVSGVGGGYSPREREDAAQELLKMYNAKFQQWRDAQGAGTNVKS